MNDLNKISALDRNSEPVSVSVKRKAEDFEDPEPKQPKREQGSATELSHLPGDVLIKIIKYLPKAQWPSLEQVDRRMQEAAHQVWISEKIHRIDEDFMFQVSKKCGQTQALLQNLLNRSPNTIEISGIDHKISENRQHREEIFQFTRLERISFAKWNIDNEDINKFLSISKSRNV